MADRGASRHGGHVIFDERSNLEVDAEAGRSRPDHQAEEKKETGEPISLIGSIQLSRDLFGTIMRVGNSWIRVRDMCPGDAAC